MQFCKQRGAGLLEMMLVVVVASLIIVFSVRTLSTYQTQKAITEIQQSAGLLMQAGTLYYDSHCGKDIQPITLTVQELADQGFLPQKDLIENPWGDPFVVNIKEAGQGTQHLYQVQVEAPRITKISLAVLNDFRKILDADPDNQMGDHLTWTRLPSYNSKKLDDSLWVMKGGLRRFTHMEDVNACLG